MRLGELSKVRRLGQISRPGEVYLVAAAAPPPVCLNWLEAVAGEDGRAKEPGAPTPPPGGGGMDTPPRLERAVA